MDNLIPEDLETRVVALMGSDIPEPGTVMFRRFMARLKLKDRDLAAELREALESPTPLVSEADPLEAERRRVAFREGLKDTWQRIFKQENLSSDMVPRRSRWVAAGVVLFGLALATIVLLYRSRPVQDLNVSPAGGLAKVIAPPAQSAASDPALLPPDSSNSANPAESTSANSMTASGNPALQQSASANSVMGQSFTNRASTASLSSFTPTPQVEPIRAEPIRYSPQRVVVQNPPSLTPRAPLSPTPAAYPKAARTLPAKTAPQPSPVLSAMGMPGQVSARMPLAAMESSAQPPGLLSSELPVVSSAGINAPLASATPTTVDSTTSSKEGSVKEVVATPEKGNTLPAQVSRVPESPAQTGEEPRGSPLSVFPESESPPVVVTSDTDGVFATTAVNPAQEQTRAEEAKPTPLKSEPSPTRAPVAATRESDEAPAQTPVESQLQPDLGLGATRATSFGLQAERTASTEGPVVVMRVKPMPSATQPNAPALTIANPVARNAATPQAPATPNSSALSGNAAPPSAKPSITPQNFTTPSLAPVTGPGVPGKPSLASPYTLGARLEGKLGYDIVLAEGMGGFQVVVETSDGMLWKGTATLDATRRVSIHFSEAFGGVGNLFAVQAMALDMGDVPGLAPAFEDQAPSLASDMVRASINALSTFTQNLANATSTTLIPGGGVSEQRQVPLLGWTVLGEVSKLFALPTDKSFVRIARVPKGTPLVILYGVGGQGVPR